MAGGVNAYQTLLCGEPKPQPGLGSPDCRVAPEEDRLAAEGNRRDRGCRTKVVIGRWRDQRSVQRERSSPCEAITNLDVVRGPRLRSQERNGLSFWQLIKASPPSPEPVCRYTAISVSRRTRSRNMSRTDGLTATACGRVPHGVLDSAPKVFSELRGCLHVVARSAEREIRNRGGVREVVVCWDGRMGGAGSEGRTAPGRRGQEGQLRGRVRAHGDDGVQAMCSSHTSFVDRERVVALSNPGSNRNSGWEGIDLVGPNGVGLQPSIA